MACHTNKLLVSVLNKSADPLSHPDYDNLRSYASLLFFLNIDYLVI